MISAHKIQENLSDYSQLFSQLSENTFGDQEFAVFKEQEKYVNQTRKLLDEAAKFDLGEIDKENSQVLFDTGRNCAKEGLLILPFETTYVEADIVDGRARRRVALLFSPASRCFDQEIFEEHPEFIGETAAIIFRRSNKVDAAGHFWKLPAHKTIVFEGCCSTSSVPAAKELADYTSMTDSDLQEIGSFSCSMLYIMHSLLNARGIELKTEFAPIKLNKKRADKNKPPLYEHHILEIGGYSSTGRVLGVGASHASPRSHWRRGHIRTIHRGMSNQKQIIIPASLINGPGFVSKDYEIFR
jgi:hypothetical protein